MSRAVGIDLGTTNSAVSVLEGGTASGTPGNGQGAEDVVDAEVVDDAREGRR